MLHKSSAPELQLKVVQRNYESISSLMHSKQQECDKVLVSFCNHIDVAVASLLATECLAVSSS